MEAVKFALCKILLETSSTYKRLVLAEGFNASAVHLTLCGPSSPSEFPNTRDADQWHSSLFPSMLTFCPFLLSFLHVFPFPLLFPSIFPFLLCIHWSSNIVLWPFCMKEFGVQKSPALFMEIRINLIQTCWRSQGSWKLGGQPRISQHFVNLVSGCEPDT